MGRLAFLAVVALASGCGGGGGGSLPLQLQFSPGTLTGTYGESESAYLDFTATVTGTTSSPTIYVVVADSGATFQLQSLSITQTGANTYAVGIAKVTPLPAGTRTGRLTVRLCGDPSCGNLLGREQLPYTLTITPNQAPAVDFVNPIDRAYLAGGPVNPIVGISGYVASGQTLYARSTDASGLITGSDPVAMTFQSEGIYTAQFAVSGDATEGRHAGSLDVTVCGDAACANVIGTVARPYTVDIAGIVAGTSGTAGAADGPGATATFSSPYDVAIDAAGNIYVADTAGTKLRKIDADGVVSSIELGGNPRGVAVASDGSVYVSDTSACVIRRVATNGTVTTVAGSAATCSAADRLNYPAGIALTSDSGGYVADASSHVVRQFTAGTQATPVYAGAYQQPGTANGAVADARFSTPTDAVRDGAGNLYVVDHSNQVIRKVTAAGQVSTFAGTMGVVGYVDGPVGTAQLTFPTHVTVDADANLYFTQGGEVRKVTPDGVVETIFYGLILPDGSQLFPKGIALSPDGQTIVVSDQSHHVIVRFTLP